MQDLIGVLNQGDPSKLIQVLDTGVDVNENLPGLSTPPLYYLITLTRWDSREMAKALLDKGANPNYIHPTNKDKDPVITKALKEEKYKVAGALIEGGADLNVLNAIKRSPLLEALHKPKLVKAMIEKGADPTLRVTEQDTTVYIEAIKEQMWEAAENLLDVSVAKGISLDTIVNATDKYGMNAAFYVEDFTGVEAIIDHEVDLNHKDNSGNTPLIASMDLDDGGEVAMEFLKNHVDVNAVSNSGETALTAAIDAGLNPIVIVALLEEGANANHKRSSDGMTPLMLAANVGYLEVVELLLENNADKTIKNNEGKTAYDLANIDEIKALLGVVEPEEPSPPWTGLTQSDVAIFDTFFAPGPPEDPEANKINWSCCPICLAYVYRSEACRYMSHDCSRQPGVILHKRLYDLYADRGMIEWCTVCGRITAGHHHYKLAPHEATKRAEEAPYNPDAVFHFGGEAECIKDGGGGIAEKVKRLDRLRTWAKELQSEVGKITERDARRELIEESWNAPLSRAPTARILQEGKFTVPATDFPAPVAPVAPEAPAPDIPKPADEVANVPEIIGEGGFDVIMRYDTAPVARFIHKKKDGTVYRHTDQELVSKEGLEAYISNQNINFGLPTFGYCFAPGCDAKLWPQDVKDLIDDAAVYEEYRKKFNEKFRAMQGGGKPLFVQATGVVCPKKKAGRKTYRRKGQITRKKTRRNKA